MAVSITSQPTTPNVTGTKLLFDITSSNINYPQYSYVMDIYQSGSTKLISRVLQTPNPDGAAQFDPSTIIYPLVTTDDDILKITNYAFADTQFKTFDFKFGEAYGSSESSSVVVYPNQTSGSVGVFNGTVNPNEGYNFPSQSYVPLFSTPQPPPIDARDAVLSDAPAYFTTSSFDDFIPVSSSDYATFSILKQKDWIFPTDTGSAFVGNDIIFAGRRVGGYFKPFNMFGYISGSNIPNNIEESVVHIPAGPQNLISSSYVIFSGSISEGLTPEEFFAYDDWLYYYISVQGVKSDSSDITETVEFYINERLVDQYYDIPAFGFSDRNYLPMYFPRTGERLRFAFANRYGALEYFNCYAPLRRSSTVERDIGSLPRVDYSNITSTYSYERRGDTEYNTETEDTYTITTPILNKLTANWLEQLLESPSVYVVQNNELVPIIITNSSYTSLESVSRQKVFTYDIQFRPSKGREIFTNILNGLPPVNV